MGLVYKLGDRGDQLALGGPLVDVLLPHDVVDVLHQVLQHVLGAEVELEEELTVEVTGLEVLVLAAVLVHHTASRLSHGLENYLSLTYFKLCGCNRNYLGCGPDLQVLEQLGEEEAHSFV